MENKQETKDKVGKKKSGNPKEKSKGPEITDKVKVELEPELDYNNPGITEDFSYIIGENPDLFEDSIVEEYMTEVLSIAARIKKRQQIRRFKSKMLIARKRSLRRRANASRIKNRAQRSAVSNTKRKLAGGRNPRDLNFSERARVEKLAARRKAAIQRQARRLVIKKRQQERTRLSNASKRR